MKKIGIWNNYTNFAKNKLFDKNAYPIGEDLWYPSVKLKDELEKRGFLLETLDMDIHDNYEAIIFMDYPSNCCYDIKKIPKYKKYLILVECEMINKNNAVINMHKNFEKVFSYNDNLVSRYGYIKLNMPNNLKDPINKEWKQKKFCTMIAGNKRSNELGELYSARLKTLKYFENNRPDLIDLYGIGWDKKIFYRNILGRIFNHIGFIQRMFAEKHSTYRGPINSKLELLSNYKYNICYENCSIIPGYISEKIFDSFFSGCVPIYWGAPNIENYIPKECFIDRRNFANDNMLFDYLISINEDEYETYLNNISVYLKSDKAYSFSSEKYADTIIRSLNIFNS